MRRTKPVAAPMVARVYLRVSTDAQDLERQGRSLRPRRPPATSPASTVKASGARADRPELLRMIGDLQPGEGGHCREDRPHQPPTFARGRKAHGGLDTGQRRKPRPSQRGRSIRHGGRGRRQRSCWKPCRSCFSPALQMARDDYEDRRERQRQGIELARRPGGTKAAVLIRSAAPKLSRCASPATASTRPPSWPGTVRPVLKRIWAEVSREPKRSSSTARSWRTH